MPKISPAAFSNGSSNWAASSSSPEARVRIADHVAGIDDDDDPSVRKRRWEPTADLFDTFRSRFFADRAEDPNPKNYNDSNRANSDGNVGTDKPRTMSFRKLFLLMWKNWLIRWRHPVLFFVEIGSVALFFGLLLLVKIQLANTAGKKNQTEATLFQEADEARILTNFTQDVSNPAGLLRRILAYAPDDAPDVRGIMDKFRELSGAQPGLDIRGYPNEDALLKGVNSLDLFGAQLKGAVVFESWGAGGGSKFTYKLRLKNFNVPTSMLFFPVSLPGPGRMERNDYLDRFTPMQYLVDASIMHWFCRSSSTASCREKFVPSVVANATTTSTAAPDTATFTTSATTTKTPTRRMSPPSPIMKDFNIALQPFPYPPYMEALQEFLSFIFGIMLPQFTVYAFLFLVPIIHMGVVKEKQSGVKELMKMMGMSRFLYWSSWLLSCVLSLSIPIVIAIVMCVAPLSPDGAIYKKSDGSVIAIFYILYALAFIAFAFFVTTFFDRLLKTIPVGILVMLITYMAPTFALNLWNVSGEGDSGVGKAAALGLCLMPNMAMVFGCRVAFAFEGRGVGIQWTNLNNAPYLRDGMTMMSVYFMLIFDIFFYMLLTMYMDTIKPGKFGVGAPLYFPFQPSFWFPRKQRTKEATSEFLAARSASTSRNKHRFFEDEPTHLKTGIEIINLRKTFRTMEGTKVAVNGLTVRAYQGQITALLGHNGAGKTTTMSILTGLYAPTSGTAVVDGFDINNSMDMVRERMGLCPQHSMLFPEIRVMEHLLLFGQLKGLSRGQATAEGKDLLHRLNLTEKKNAMADNLSGGQKRKLSLAMALIGGSETVILDEPTSGMDPEARRNMWDYLQEQKGKRTILLTTHFMEEADVLGDRIAIMAEGKLQCCGTPMYLKKQYGTGITLSMLKREDEGWDKVKAIVKQQMPLAAVKSESGNEIAFKLPQDRRAEYPALLNALESNRDQLGVLNFSIAATTMEEVFLRVGEGIDEEIDEEIEGIENVDAGMAETEFVQKVDQASKPMKNGYPSESVQSLTSNKNRRRNQGFNLFLQRLRAVVTKKILYLRRTWSLVISQIVLPVLTLIAALLIDKALNSASTSPFPLPLTPASYAPSNYFYRTDDGGTGIPLAQQAADNYAAIVAAANPAAGGVSAVQAPSNSTMTAYLLSRGASSIVKYRTEDLAAADFVKAVGAGSLAAPLTARAMFQTIPLHSAGIAVNLINNAVLRTVTGQKDLKIDVANHPLPKTPLENVIQNFPIEGAGGFSAFNNMDSDFVYVTIWGTGIFLIACSFLVFPIEERACGSKQLQLMSGMRAQTYWLGHIIGDAAVFLVATCLFLILLAAINASGIFLANGSSALGALFILLLFYTFASMPFSYFHSYFFSTAGTGFAIHIMDNLLFGVIGTSAVVLLETANTEDLLLAARIVKWIFRFFPPFPFAHALFLLVERAYANNRCSFIPKELSDAICVPNLPFPLPPSVQACCPNCGTGNLAKCFEPANFFAWDEPGIGVDLLMLVASGCIFYALLFVWETGIQKRITQSWYKEASRALDKRPIDVDVQRENERVKRIVESRGRLADDVLVVSGLKKVFKELVAVENISVGVHHGECFGLLGVNGAGKTTTFKMLTGEEMKTAGKAFLMGYDLDAERSSFLQLVGYCPQFDGLVDVMTGDEMLYMYCRLRGMPEEQIASHVKDLINRLGLQNHWSRRCGNYSGGNKRKLSAAMAMAAEPAVLFLDEPTSGVDPVSRRRIWKALTFATNNGQSIVLTSHSMEECEALCNRLGIMVNGKFQCLGPVQHLKQKFCQGYSVQIKLKSKEDLDGQLLHALRYYIESTIPQSFVQDLHEGLIHYHIRDSATTWQLIFSTMEEARSRWPNFVEDYAVGETTLEQIFLSFAREQVPDASRYSTRCCCFGGGGGGKGRRPSELEVVVAEQQIRPVSGFTM